MSQPWHQPTGKTIKLGQIVYEKPHTRPKQEIHRIGDGPCEASVSHALERQPFCWDCNGFYRRLGLLPGSSRAEVGMAYLRLNGHRSSMLTNAARVLIDKGTKKRYDALPLGSFWADDESLVQAVLDDEMETLHDEDLRWSVYVSGVVEEEVDHEQVNTWRVMIAFLLWRARSPVTSFSMGVALDFGAAIVGYRLVAFVPLPLTSKPAWHYAAEVAETLQRVQATSTPPM